MRVLVIGLTRELPLSPTDAMDIADMLVARAASAHTEGTENTRCRLKNYYILPLPSSSLSPSLSLPPFLSSSRDCSPAIDRA
jgi:hypothetical protein